jgi:hypothetical protein
MSFIIYPMKKLEHFELKKGYAVFRPVGKFSFDEMAHLMNRAALLSRRHKIGKLLIVSTGASGFHLPGISERYNLAEHLALDAASLVKIAHVASPEWVRSGKFDVMVAHNRGLDAENFDTESAALEWLLQPAKNRRSANNPASPRINPS